jgi:hypothetical protein
VNEQATELYTIAGLDRPLGLQEFEVPRSSRQSELESGKVVSPTHQPQEIFLVLISVRS